MPHVDRGFVDYVIDQIDDPLVIAKGMFGGFGLYRDGVFFGIVYDGMLYFKTSPRTVGKYVSEGMEPFRPTPKQTLKRYYEVPERVLEDRDELGVWARESWFDANIA